jgi:hypothetical protein
MNQQLVKSILIACVAAGLVNPPLFAQTTVSGQAPKQFGHVLGDNLDNQVLLIKTAWGGKSLYRDFRPPSSGGAVGPYYTKMLGDVREALANLVKDLRKE